MCASRTSQPKHSKSLHSKSLEQKIEETIKESWIKIANPETFTHAALAIGSVAASAYLIQRILRNSPGTLLALESGNPAIFAVSTNLDVIQWLTGGITKKYQDLSPETKQKVDELTWKWAIIFAILGTSAMVFAGDTILDFITNLPGKLKELL